MIRILGKILSGLVSWLSLKNDVSLPRHLFLPSFFFWASDLHIQKMAVAECVSICQFCYLEVLCYIYETEINGEEEDEV